MERLKSRFFKHTAPEWEIRDCRTPASELFTKSNSLQNQSPFTSFRIRIGHEAHARCVGSTCEASASTLKAIGFCPTVWCRTRNNVKRREATRSDVWGQRLWQVCGSSKKVQFQRGYITHHHPMEGNRCLYGIGQLAKLCSFCRML